MNRIVIATACLALAACSVTPQTEATLANMVEIQNGAIVRVTEAGPNTIVCQDYWQNFTLWDRAVTAPAGMSRADADGICRSKEQMALEAPTAKPWEPIFNSRSNRPDPALRGAVNAQPSRPGDVLAR